ncbi:hypothetical protein [Blastomonas sp. SL216]|uniref:hypothetical protein n=1 Tax=Blastomonas sp. SL216 TaxID=2995169 RepID=UPI002376E0C8|nr:hypothetical protein OU999_08145 [Blastomonas sp. SL216]
MNLLHDEIDDFLNRFNSFNDAVARRWAIISSNENTNVAIELEACDLMSKVSEWRKIKLMMADCRSVAFVKNTKIDYEVLSSGLYIVYCDGLFGLEFGDFHDAPNSLEEIITSRCHVVAASVAWEFVEPA